MKQDQSGIDDTEGARKFFRLILLFVVVAIAASAILNGGAKQTAAKDRYTLGGEKIQDNGLTAKQEAKIRLHCAENPRAWDCR